MSYADSLLSTGERIELRERQHWFILVWAGRLAILAIVGALILGFLANGLNPDGVSGTIRSLASLIFVVLLVFGIASFVWEALRYRHQEYVISNRRVMQVGGVINKHSTDSSLEKINDAALSQSLFGRMFGFGDLDILTASESGIERFRMIQDPITFKKAMLDAKHEYELEMSRGPLPVSPPLRAAPEAPPERSPEPVSDETSSVNVPPPAPAAPPPPPAPPPSPASDPPEARMSPDEVTRTLASLADLRDRGAISPEDYEQKKADLLGRI
jgi:hypothetical protein